MYEENFFGSILIVRLSSLGDIIQAFTALDYLRQRFPNASIDWVVEESLAPLVASHPFIRKTLSLDLKGMKKGWKKVSSWRALSSQISHLRQETYDLLFDFQGNCKSAVVNLFCKSKIKIGFGFHSVREKPNLLSTHIRFDVPRKINIREQNISLIQKFLKVEETCKFPDLEKSKILSQFAETSFETQGMRLKISKEEVRKIEQILCQPTLQTAIRMMVCPGSKWINKQLPQETFADFLQKISEQFEASFLLVWGAESEKAYCEAIHRFLPKRSLVIEKLSMTTWQNLMNEVDLVIAVDSSALHLCGTTKTPTFSLFGPTNPDVFRPTGSRHFSLQGKCPYGKTFDKTCSLFKNLLYRSLYSDFKRYSNFRFISTLQSLFDCQTREL